MQEGEGSKVYVFGDRYLGEADETNNPTYVGRGVAGLNLFKSHSSSLIFANKPQEFWGRVVRES